MNLFSSSFSKDYPEDWDDDFDEADDLAPAKGCLWALGLSLIIFGFILLGAFIIR